MKTSTRLMSSVGSALVISLGLFYFMNQLISGGNTLKKSDDTENFIEFVRIKRPSHTESRKRKLPQKPKPQEKMMDTKQMNIAKTPSKPSRPQNMKFDTPKLDIPLTTGPGMALSNAGGGIAGAGGDSEAIPLVLTEPMYPREAAMKGLSGYVVLKFDIMPDGVPANVVVLSSKPNRVFDQAATRAALRSKFKAAYVDGKPVKQKNKTYRYDFRLE